MDLEKLKSKAYDCMVQLDYWRAELNKINQLIAQENQKPKEKPDDKKEATDKRT